MAKFTNLLKYRLKNSQHFDFIEAFVTVCKAKGFTSAKIVTLLGVLESALGEEDTLFMRVRASSSIAERNRWDRTRDDRYARLHRLVNVWAGSGIGALDEAATALKQVFELYKLNTQAQVNEESGVMTNLAQDLATEAMQAHIDAIGGSQLYQEMVEANEQVKTFRLAQGTEESQKVLAALEKARKATDEAYDKLCDAIEGGASFADDPAPYEAFITEWNGTIKLYQDMLDRKSGNAGQSQNPGGNGSENPGEPGNTDDPDNPENPDNPDNPENPENPDNPTNPTNPTEPGSGGGGGSTPDDGDGME